MKIKNFTLLFSALVMITPEVAHAWGQYGHEQVNDAAITLLNGANGLGKCFGDNRYVVRRMAISPDVEWKADMQLPSLGDDDKAKRYNDDKYEHPMHFNEVDAWIPNPRPGEVSTLPAGEFKDEFGFYQDRLRKNAAYVTEVDPEKKLKDPANPSVNEVTDHGTAPWRVLQLYRLGVEALKKKDVKLAMLYLGTMGHYVGDMSQPFHTTLNFDGEHYPVPAAGVHHEIDTGVLPQKGKDENSVYPSFAATEGPVLEAARKTLSDAGKIDEEHIVAEVFKLIDQGYGLVGSFLKDYSEDCASAQQGKTGALKRAGRAVAAATARPKPAPKPAARPTTHPGPAASDSAKPPHREASEPSSETNAPYCVTRPAPKPGARPQTRALPAAYERHFGSRVAGPIGERLGDAAALLARIWALAYESAGRPGLDGCASVTFDQSYVIQNYPRPSSDGPHGYLPSGYTPGHR